MLMQGKQGADAVFNSETLTSSVIHWTPSMLTKWERLYKPLLKMSSFPLPESYYSVYLMLKKTVLNQVKGKTFKWKQNRLLLIYLEPHESCSVCTPSLPYRFICRVCVVAFGL